MTINSNWSQNSRLPSLFAPRNTENNSDAHTSVSCRNILVVLSWTMLLSLQAGALTCPLQLLPRTQVGILHNPMQCLVLLGQQSGKKKLKCGRADTVWKGGDKMHIQKHAMKNAQVWGRKLVSYLLWDVLLNWKCIAHRMAVSCPPTPSLSSLAGQPLRVWSKNQESVSYLS